MKTYTFKKAIQRIYGEEYKQSTIDYHYHPSQNKSPLWQDDTIEFEGRKYVLNTIRTWYTDYKGRPDSVETMNADSAEVECSSVQYLQDEDGHPVTVSFENDGTIRVSTQINDEKSVQQHYSKGKCVHEQVFNEVDYYPDDEDEESIQEYDESDIHTYLNAYDTIELNDHGDPVKLAVRYHLPDDNHACSIMICEYEY